MNKRVGPSFSDFVTAGPSRRRNSGINIESRGLRNYFPYFALIVCFLLILLKLFFLQVVRGEYYRNLSDGNRTRVNIIKAQRGIILDRNDKALVRNVPAFAVVDKDKVTFIDKDTALQFIAQNKGKSVVATVQREYVYNDYFAHILGYTGQITSDQLLLPKYKDYRSGDFLGKMGVEKEYESYLRGIDGKELYEVNSKGETTRSLGREEPVSGYNVKTTLDLELQKAVYNAMSGIDKGVVIVSDPRDGGILAMVSKPAFDPNLFTHSKNYKTESQYKNVEDIVEDSHNQPLLNRAIAGVYPPGSTYKLVTAVAGLESKAISKTTKIEDTGVLKVGDFSYGNWYFSSYGRTEGWLDVIGAIKRSNDIFFYKTAEETGVNKIKEMSKKFGLGRQLGIDIDGEEEGNLPDETWKKTTIGENWYLGDTYHLGIGQGYLLTTPLQVNFWTMVFANNGILYKPHVIFGKKEILSQNFINQENIDLVREGMKESCAEGGVAYPFFQFKVPAFVETPVGRQNLKFKFDGKDFIETEASQGAKFATISIGCKTGTAETTTTEKPHAWFTAFAPYYHPEVVITVLVERGGEGSSVAAPIAKRILEEYFKNKL